MASKKKVTPARQKALQEYNKERRRVQTLVRNAEKRGYFFDHNIIPPTVTELNVNNIPTVTIKARTRKLHETKPIHYYKQATAVSMETGKVVSGVQRRREERHESAIAGSINRAEKQKELRSIQKIREYWEQKENEVRAELGDEKDYDDYGVNLPTEESKPTPTDEVQQDLQRARESLTPEQKQQAIDEEERQFQQEQAERDKANLERLQSDKDFREQFSIGNVILRSIQEMIDSAMSDGTYKQAGMDLSIELSQQISQYGKDKVAMAIAQVPQEAIEDAQVALNYNPGDERHDKAIIALRELITGEVPSAQELKDMQDRMDADAYTNDVV